MLKKCTKMHVGLCLTCLLLLPNILSKTGKCQRTVAIIDKFHKNLFSCHQVVYSNRWADRHGKVNKHIFALFHYKSTKKT